LYTYHHLTLKYTSCSTQLGNAEIPISKNGYLFVFVSNEIVRFAHATQSNKPANGQCQGSVYFDDLTIQHTPGNLLEEHHYYPTGLEMFALSSSASNGHACPDKGGVSNRYGYQGQEHENTFALNLNEFEARHYACPDKGGNSKTGRWMVPDPALQFPSPYVGMGNQWVSGVDPDGRAVLFVGAKLVGALIGGIANMIANKDQIKAATEGEKGNAWRGIGMALGCGVVGAAGVYSGIAIGGVAGFAIGGGLNVIFEAATGQFDGDEINKFGRNTGSFLTGGFSALAGKNFGESLTKG